MAKRKNQGYCLHVDIDHKLWNNYNPNQLGQARQESSWFMGVFVEENWKLLQKHL